MKQQTYSIMTKALGSGLFVLFFLFPAMNMLGQTYEGLYQLEGYRIKTFYSQGSEELARNMSERCTRVLTFYKDIIDFEPTVTLLVLSKEDWSTFTSFPVYGMPHYTNKNTLIVASEDNEFWKSFIPPVDELPEELAAEVKKTYSEADGSLSMRGFFDLLAIHELGHAFHKQGGLNRKTETWKY